MLSHCATDFGHPVSREWALLCVRNACEAHTGNQTFIQELRPQEVVIQDEKLREQGLRVEMNTETGQFKFINTNTKDNKQTKKTTTTSSSNNVNASAAEAIPNQMETRRRYDHLHSINGGLIYSVTVSYVCY